jgi:hypothetical protein
MAYDETVAQRVRKALQNRSNVSEKKMFGGVAFILSGNMCCGVLGDSLMARVGPDQYEHALRQSHAKEMDFTGRSMKGFVYVSPEGFQSDADLKRWLNLCIDFAASLPAK